MAEWNPGFSFAVQDPTGTVQAPWDFRGTLIEAGLQPSLGKRTCTVASNPRKRAKISPVATAVPSSDDSSLSSDAPLPGELDGEGSDSDVSSLQSEDEQGSEAAKDEAQSSQSSDSEQPVEVGPGSAHELAEASSDSDAFDTDVLDTVQLQDRKQSRKGAGARPQSVANFFEPTPEGTTYSAQAFSDLQLSRPLLRACTALGYQHPTPIQAACIPIALMGRDISGSALTGSGKTAAFALPILERLLFREKRVAATYALILTPTRELAAQVHSMLQRLAQFTDIRVALVVGGLSQQVQAATLRSSPEIIVATPGRLIDHVRNTQSVGLEDLQTLVLDEADRLLDMGFSDEVAEIVRQAPRGRQTMLFSATMTDEVQKLESLSLRRPVRLAADEVLQAPAALTQEIVRLKGAKATNKEAVLLALAAKSFSAGSTIVFCGTKQTTHRIHLLFQLLGLPSSAELHGNLTQTQRLQSLELFRQGEAKFLLATDVAARGLDILGVKAVINFEAPSSVRSYLHRVGRTARAGNAGRALTLVEDGDRASVKAVIKQTGAKLLERAVTAAAVAGWSSRIERHEQQLQLVLQEEREDQALRKAEMEAQKATNMIDHEDEIQARPARTWFQTEQQKKRQKVLAREASSDRPGSGKGAAGGKQAKNAESKKLCKGDKDRAEKRQKANEARDEETKQAVKGVRAAKARESQLRQTGVRPSVARKEALSAGRNGKKLKPKQRTKQGSKGAPAEGELFEGTGRPGGASKSKVYAGGGRSGKLRTQGGTAKSEKNKHKRHGKGVKSFKSKKRHKRR